MMPYDAKTFYNKVSSYNAAQPLPPCSERKVIFMGSAKLINDGKYLSGLANLGLTSLSHFINDGTVIFVPLVADLLSVERNMSPLLVTLMLLLFYGISSPSSAYVGRLVDRSGRSGFYMGLGLLLLAAGLFGFFISVQTFAEPIYYDISLVSSAVSGLGSAFYHPIGATILQSSFKEKSRGKALGVNGAVGSLGRAVYPVLFFIFSAYMAKSGSLLSFGIIGFAASMIVFAFMWREPGATTKSKGIQASHGFKNALTKGIIILTVVAFARSAVTQGIISWAPEYFTYGKSLGFSASLGIALTTMYAAGIIGQPMFGLLVGKMNKRVLLAVSFIGTSLSLFAYLYVSGLFTTLFLALFGLFTFSGFPLFFSLTSDYVPRGSSTTGNALVWGLGMTGGSVIGPLLPPLITGGSFAGLTFAFAVLALINLLIIAGIFMLPEVSEVGKVSLFG